MYGGGAEPNYVSPAAEQEGVKDIPILCVREPETTHSEIFPRGYRVVEDAQLEAHERA